MRNLVDCQNPTFKHGLLNNVVKTAHVPEVRDICHPVD